MQRCSYLVLVLLATVAGFAGRLDAQTSEQAAAVLYFPYLVIDTSRGLDTRLQLSNASPSEAIEVRCFYFNNGHCHVSGAACTGGFLDCGLGDFCDVGFSETAFPVRLTRGQPVSWLLSQGLAHLPCQQPSDCPGGDLNADSSVPPVADTSYVGSMVCVATDSSGLPVDRNDLTGTASVERYQAVPTRLDVARYSAIGLPAIPGTNDHDDALVLGGTSPVIPSLNTRPEYQGCPGTVILDAVADGAPDPIAAGRQVFTTLALLPCGLNTQRIEFAAPVVQILVFNEYEQRFSTSERIGPLRLQRLSRIDTSRSEFSIFGFNLLGTLASQLRIKGFGRSDAPDFGRNGGFVAVAIEEHVDPQDPTNFSWAAIKPHFDGNRTVPDYFVAAPDVCTRPTAPLTCGDGHVCGSETCDDGNTNNGDGCDSTCQIEPCYTCSTSTPLGASACVTSPTGTSCTDDFKLCTLDQCNGSGVCLHLPGPAGKTCASDETLCTTDVCDAMGVCTHPPVAADTPCEDDFNACTFDLCDAAGTCTHPQRPAGSPCEDDFAACTLDQCDAGGVCVHLPLAAGTPCEDDFNTCTIDQCDDAGFCTYSPGPAGVACEDDFDPCTVDQCGADGSCMHSVIEVCGDGKTCGAEQCDDGNTVNGDGCEADCALTPG